ncbi:unnamed protein product, partial [Timema podura]|nr:unnamed protein product [Timema podura]
VKFFQIFSAILREFPDLKPLLFLRLWKSMCRLLQCSPLKVKINTLNMAALMFQQPTFAIPPELQLFIVVHVIIFIDGVLFTNYYYFFQRKML